MCIIVLNVLHPMKIKVYSLMFSIMAWIGTFLRH